MLKPLLKVAYYVDHGFNKALRAYQKKVTKASNIKLIAYQGLGSLQRAYISGRLIEKRNIKPAGEQDSKFNNLLSMYKRFESKEIPGASIQAIFYGRKFVAKTNSEGYFSFNLPVPKDIDPSLDWHNVELELLDTTDRAGEIVKTTAQILIPQPNAEYGIISDIDDTVLQTNATNFIRMMQKTFLHNAKTRLPFKGVAGFYRALHLGSRNPEIKNPLYFVSSSPWNLYDMLEDFFKTQQIPIGPFMLRHLSLNPKKLFRNSHHDHKLRQIEKIFTFTEELPFILIGDSGQHDPEIYMRVVKNHPGRILAVYIRDVSKEKRDQQVYALTDEMYQYGTEMIFVRDTEAAARHAISQGYISEKGLEEVQEEKRKDQEAPE